MLARLISPLTTLLSTPLSAMFALVLVILVVIVRTLRQLSARMVNAIAVEVKVIGPLFALHLNLTLLTPLRILLHPTHPSNLALRMREMNLVPIPI